MAIPRKKKKCLNCGRDKLLFGKGVCQSCYKIRTYKPISKISKKQLDRNAKYRNARDEYMSAHKECEAKLDVCTKVATDLHHKRSRIGSYLTDKRHFMAVCRNCHRKIEDGGKWVYEMGFKTLRTTK